MKRFQTHPPLLKSGPGCVVVRKYNKIALALTNYEIVHYRTWVQLVEQAQHWLHVSHCTDVTWKKSIYASLTVFVQIPVLVRCNGILEPNLHSSVVSMMEEAKWMAQLGVKVPPEANSITMVTIKKYHDQIKVRVL